MTINSVAVGEAVLDSTMNQLITNVNGSPNRAVITVSTTWSIPNGVHQFKVTVCGGGGCGNPGATGGGGEGSFPCLGGPGGISPYASVIVSGQDIGSSFSVTIGVGGNPNVGGSSSFGTLLSMTGGAVGGTPNTTVPSYIGLKGSPGIVGGTLAASAIKHAYGPIYDYVNNIPRNYGEGGPGVYPGDPISPGAPGVVIIEW